MTSFILFDRAVDFTFFSHSLYPSRSSLRLHCSDAVFYRMCLTRLRTFFSVVILEFLSFESNFQHRNTIHLLVWLMRRICLSLVDGPRCIYGHKGSISHAKLHTKDAWFIIEWSSLHLQVQALGCWQKKKAWKVIDEDALMSSCTKKLSKFVWECWNTDSLFR